MSKVTQTQLLHEIRDAVNSRTSIVPPEVQREHCEILSQLKIILPDIKAELEQTKKVRKECADRFESQNSRLTVMETEKKTALKLIGGGSVFGGLIGYLFQLLFKHI